MGSTGSAFRQRFGSVSAADGADDIGYDISSTTGFDVDPTTKEVYPFTGYYAEEFGSVIETPCPVIHIVVVRVSQTRRSR